MLPRWPAMLRATSRVLLIAHVCTATFTLHGIVLGEVDFLASARAKIDMLVQRAGGARSKRPSKGPGAGR